MQMLASVVFAFTGAIGTSMAIAFVGSIFSGAVGRAYGLSGRMADLQRKAGHQAAIFLEGNALRQERGDTNLWHPRYLRMQMQAFARKEEDGPEILDVLVLAAEYQYLMSLTPSQWKERPVMEFVYQVMADQPRRQAVVESQEG